jgi:hypothetical protein
VVTTQGVDARAACAALPWRRHRDAHRHARAVQLHHACRQRRRGYVDIGSALAKAKTLFFGHGPVPARSPFVFRDRVYERIATMLGSYFFMGRA